MSMSNETWIDYREYEMKQDPKSWKISNMKIWCDEKTSYLNQKYVQILNLSKNAKKILENLNVENFPKVFVISIDFDEEIDELLELIADKFTNRPVLVEVKEELFLHYYTKRENEFKIVESDSYMKFTAEIFISNLKTSIIEAEFSDIVNFFGNDLFLNHCLALDADDDFCFRLLNLFDDHFTPKTLSEILLPVIKLQKFNFFLAFFNVFDPLHINEVNQPSDPKLYKILDHLMQTGQIKEFKVALKCLCSFLSLNDIRSLMYTSKTHKAFYELLKNSKLMYEIHEEKDVSEFAAVFGFTDLFLTTLKSRNSSPDVISSFIQRFNEKNDLNSELKIQKLLIELLSNERFPIYPIFRDKFAFEIVSWGFESNLKFLYSKIIEIYTKNDVIDFSKAILSKVISNNPKIDSVIFAWKIFKKNFTRKRLKFFIESYLDDFLSTAVQDAKSQEIFEFIWMKIKSLIVDDVKMKEFLLSSDIDDSNFLISSTSNERTFYFVLEKVYCEHFKLKEFIYETNTSNENFFQKLIQRCSTPMVEFASNLLKNRLSSEDFKEFLLTKGSNGKNIFHFASESLTDVDSLKFLSNLIKSNFDIEKLRKMLSEGHNLPCHYAFEENFHEPKVIVNFVSLYEEIFSFAELQKILSVNKLCQLYISHNFFAMSRNCFNVRIVKKLLTKYFDPMVSFFFELHDLMMAESELYIDLIMFWENIEKKHDVVHFLVYEVKIFNIFAEFIVSKPKFEYLCQKIELFVQDGKKLKEILLAYDECEVNALNITTESNYIKKDSFTFLFTEIYCKYLKLDEFIYKKNSQGDNFFHQLTKLGSSSFIELVVAQIKAELPKNKFEEFLRLRNDTDENFLQLSVKGFYHYENSNFEETKKKLNFAKNLILNELNCESFREMLLEKDENGHNLFHLILRKCTKIEIFRFCASTYMENFSYKEVHAIIQEANDKKFFDDETIEDCHKIILRIHNKMVVLEDCNISSLFEEF